jgi:DNA-binding response OmpR family regulator
MRRYGYDSVLLADFGGIKEQFVELKPDLVIMDVNLPRFDGFYWCRQIRTISHVPIIFLSARTGDMDQVFAIENGGDDYVTKPFSLEVLMAKVQSALRRAYGEYALSPASSPNVWTVSGLTFDEDRHTLAWGEREVELTQNEFRLAKALALKSGSIVPRDELLEALWDDIAFVDDNTLTVNVARVRSKLTEIGLNDAIQTRRGFGYVLTLSGIDHV